MASRSFLSFGSKPSAEEKKVQELKRLDSLTFESRKELASVKNELERAYSGLKKLKDDAKKQSLALKALGNEAGKRLKTIELKEVQLKEFEYSISKKESALRSEEHRIIQLKSREGFLRSAISTLERAFAERASLLDERKKAVARLTGDISALVKKRSELHFVESSLRETLAREKNLRENLVKMEKRVADGAGLVSKQREEAENYNRTLGELRSRIQQNTAVNKQIESEIAEAQKALSRSRQELVPAQKELAVVLSQKKDFDNKRFEFEKREKIVLSAEARLQRVQEQLSSLRAEAEGIEKNKQELYALIEEKKHLVNELGNSISENFKFSKEAGENREKMRKTAQELLAVQNAHEKKIKLFESKEKSFIAKETTIVEHEKSLKDAARLLAGAKNEFLGDVNARKAELLLLQQEWEKRLEELKSEKKELRVEKQDVRSLLESDISALKDKEDELSETVILLEKDKVRLSDEEKALVKKISEFERAKRGFEREKSILSGKEKHISDGERILKKGMAFVEKGKKTIETEQDKIYRSRNLKKVLPVLEHRYQELKKLVSKAEARLVGGFVEPSRLESFKKREKELSVREKGVEFELGRLMEQENSVEQLEQRKEKAFSEYLHEEVERAKQGVAGREVVNPEIHSMLDDAREKLMQGDVDEAILLVSESEVLVDRLQNQEQKRMFSYDLKDLKASIKLAMLK